MSLLGEFTDDKENPNSYRNEFNYNAYLTAALGFTSGLAAGGGLSYGIIGAGFGVATSLIDDFIIKNKSFFNVDKHLLSSTSLWTFILTNSFLFKNLPLGIFNYILIVGAAFSISYYFEDFFNFYKKISDYLDSHDLLKKLLNEDWHKFELLYYKESFLKLAQMSLKTVLVLYLGTVLQKQNLSYFIDFIKNFAGSKESAPHFSIGQNFYGALVYAAWMALDTFIPIIFDFFIVGITKEQESLIINSSLKIINKQGNSRKLLSYGLQGKALQTELISNLYTAKRSTQEYLNLQEKFFEFLLSYYWSFTKLREIVVIKIFLDLMAQPISSYFINQKKQIIVSKQKSYTEASELINNIKYHSDALEMREGNSFIKAAVSVPLKEFDHFERLKKNNEFTTNSLEMVLGIFNYLFPAYAYYLIRTKELFDNPKLFYQNLPIITKALQKVSYIALSEVDSNKQNLDFKICNQKLQEFYNIISKEVTSTLNKTENDQRKLGFYNYSIFIDNKELLRIDKLELEMGKRYAIVGDNGSGKTTLMKDLKSGLVGNLFSTGEISKPQGVQIIMLDQGVFLPDGLKFKDVIKFPLGNSHLNLNEKNVIEEVVKYLLRELEVIDNNELDRMLSSQGYILSGGQRKKIGIMQVILEIFDKDKDYKHEDVLIILDESFSELSETNIIKVQEILKQYLPKSTFLVIDHNVKLSESANFYDEIIKFNSYDFRYLKSPNISLSDKEIGIFVDEKRDYYLKFLDKELLHLDKANISKAVEEKILKSSKLNKNDKRELKDYALLKGFITHDTWLEKEKVTYESKSNSNISLFGDYEPICSSLKHEISRDLPAEDKQIYNIICDKYCDCPQEVTLLGEL